MTGCHLATSSRSGAAGPSVSRVIGRGQRRFWALPLLNCYGEFLLKRRLNRHPLPPGRAEPSQRLEFWRHLPLEIALDTVALCPKKPVAPMPADPITHYLPDPVDFCGYRLDAFNEQAQEEISESHLDQDFFNKEGLADIFSAWAVRLEVAGDFGLALRSRLNALRLGRHGAVQFAAIADCFLALHHIDQAGLFFWRAADDYEAGGRVVDGAVMYEQAALCSRAASVATAEMEPWRLAAKACALYSTAGNYQAASRCYILEQDFSDCNLMKRLMRLFWLYGESPIFAVRALVGSIVVFAFLQLFAGFSAPEHRTISYDLAFALPSVQSSHDFLEAVYYSAVTITTLGYGDYLPIDGTGRLLCAVEALWGLPSAGMVLVCLQRRFVGR